MLGRVLQGERDVWHEVRVPSETDEAGRQPQRELRTLKRDRTRVVNRIGGLLVTQGIRVKVRADFGLRLAELRTWRGDPLPSALRDRLAREWEKVALLTRQIGTIEQGRRAQLRTATSAEDPSLRMVRQLLRLRGIGDQSAWPLVTELFGWRALRNRRQVGGLTGLTGTPYNSGTREREQGISRAGNAEIRALAIELAWCWLQYQPQSALAQWYQQRWANGGVGSRKRGIVAVARRLMVDLWRYVDAGVIPDGAQLKASASPVPRGT
jgi:transposase